MTTPFKLGNVVLCEHIVEGLRNKHTLINTYSGDILVEEFPAIIPVSFYIEVRPTGAFKGEIMIKLLLGRKEAMRGGAAVDFQSNVPAVVAIPTGLLQIQKATTMKLLIGIEGDHFAKGFEKTISLNEATPQPTV